MTKLLAHVTCIALATTLLTSCSAAPPPAGTRSSAASATTATASGYLSDLNAADGLSALRAEGSRAVPSTETSKLSASDALQRIRVNPVEGRTTILTIAKARVSNGSVKDRLAWVIGFAPVVIRLHGGGPGNPPANGGRRIGRGVTVLDAMTGEHLESSYSNIP